MTITLIPIVWKKKRVVEGKAVVPFKYWGGLLNPDKQFYVRKIMGNHNPMSILTEAKQTHGQVLV